MAARAFLVLAVVLSILAGVHSQGTYTCQKYNALTRSCSSSSYTASDCTFPPHVLAHCTVSFAFLFSSEVICRVKAGYGPSQTDGRGGGTPSPCAELVPPGRCLQFP